MFNGFWRIARVAGIDVSLHWSFSLLVVWIIGQAALGGRGWAGLVMMSVALFLLFGCVTLHELGHALTARGLGMSVKNVIILPVGGLAQVRPLPAKPLYDLLVAAAGPLVNLALATLAAAILVVWGKLGFLLGFLASPETVVDAMMNNPFHPDAISGFVIFLLLINGVLFAFNLLPAFPMDGGRILRAALVMFLPYPQATRAAQRVGQLIAVFILLAAVMLKSFELFLVGGLVLITGALMKVET